MREEDGDPLSNDQVSKRHRSSQKQCVEAEQELLSAGWTVFRLTERTLLKNSFKCLIFGGAKAYTRDICRFNPYRACGAILSSSVIAGPKRILCEGKGERDG